MRYCWHCNLPPAVCCQVMHAVPVLPRCAALRCAMLCRMMHELALTSKVRQPGVPYNARAYDTKALVRTRLELLPDSADPQERRGRLRVTVSLVGAGAVGMGCKCGGVSRGWMT